MRTPRRHSRRWHRGESLTGESRRGGCRWPRIPLDRYQRHAEVSRSQYQSARSLTMQTTRALQPREGIPSPEVGTLQQLSELGRAANPTSVETGAELSAPPPK